MFGSRVSFVVCIVVPLKRAGLSSSSTSLESGETVELLLVAGGEAMELLLVAGGVQWNYRW